MTATALVDRNYGTVWMTGGINGLNQSHADSYVWDPALSDWKVVSVADPLMVRSNHAMARNPANGYPMLFGGLTQSGSPLQDTVIFDGARWQALGTRNAPPQRDTHAMAYDEARGRVVLFGGRGDAGNPILGDTWEFDGRDWNSVRTAVSPPGRWNHTLVYDPQRGRVVLTGGRSGFRAFFTDVWEFDGRNWVERAPNTTNPSARWNAAAAFDTKRTRMLLFGGGTDTGPLGDTWEYFASTDVGTLEPWLGAQPMSVFAAPILGAPLRLAFASPLGTGALFLAAGASNRALLPVAPPLSCEVAFLHLDPATALQLPASGDPCVGGFDVPNDAAFLGVGLSAQGVGMQAGPCIKVSLPLVFSLRAP